MRDTECLSQAIRDLYEIIDRLGDDWSEHARHFTLDGHLLGSMGEVYAAEHYGIELYPPSNKAHDGIATDGTGRKVQIKVTQTRARKQQVPLSHEPEHLLVFQVDDKGRFEPIYNGPGKPAWDIAKNKASRTITKNQLIRLNTNVPEEDRIMPQ